jgi:hypothetical protein
VLRAILRHWIACCVLRVPGPEGPLPMGRWESVPREAHGRTHARPDGLERTLVRRRRRLPQIFIKGSNVVLVQICDDAKSDGGPAKS